MLMYTKFRLSTTYKIATFKPWIGRGLAGRLVGRQVLVQLAIGVEVATAVEAMAMAMALSALKTTLFCYEMLRR